MSEPLEQVLARADDALREAQARQAGVPLDPRVLAALSSVTGPATPLPARCVAERVRRGALSWEEAWADPRGPEGLRVVQTALVALARCIDREAPRP